MLDSTMLFACSDTPGIDHEALFFLTMRSPSAAAETAHVNLA